jgi:Rne/Rng family ribonuclease
MKRVLINVEDRELRIAILEDEQLTELYIESLDDKTILNNIYKGRVEGVLPGLSAAFVNIGFERNAFLHFDDVRPDLLLELQAKREGREVPAAAAVPEAPPEAEATYEPTPEEIEVVSALEASEPEVPQIVPAAASAEPFPRRRRRGRRGGRNRRKHRGAPGSAAGISEGQSPGGEAPMPPAGQEVSAQPSAPDFQRSGSPAGAPAQGGGNGPARADQPGRQDRQRRKRQPQQQGQQQGRRRRTGPVLPPPDAIRGTRAASNPYDVFTPYALPRGQKTDRKRRRKTPAHPTLEHIIGPTSLPPDMPIEKDSQLDFFGPAQTRAGGGTPDEPAEDNYSADQARPQADEEFLDESNGNVAHPSPDAQPGKSPRKPPRRRSMRRRGGAPYAVRRKSDPDDESTSSGAPGDAAESAEKPKRRTRSRKSEAAAQETPAAAAVESAAVFDEATSDAPAAATRPRRSPRKKAGESAPQAEAPAGEAAPQAGEAQPAATGSPREKASSRSRRKAVSEPASEDASSAAPAPSAAGSVEPAAAGEAKVSAKRPRRRSKAGAEHVTAPSDSQPATGPTGEIEAPAPPAGGDQSVSAATLASQEPAAPSAAPTESTFVTGAGERAEAAAPGETAPAAPQISDQGVAAPVVEQESVGGEPTATPAGHAQEEPASAPFEAGPQASGESPAGAVAEPQPPQAPHAPRHLHHPPRQERWHRPRVPRVPEVMRKGDEILVQVTKEEIGGKGARISTYVSLPGRYLVLLPFGNNEGGVSRRVESYEERRRLKRLQQKIRQELGIDHMGLIIRTAGMERNENELRKDAEFLLSEWRRVEERAAKVTAPALVYDDSDILYRLCRDVFDESIDEIIVDDPASAEKIRGILRAMIPELEPRVKLYEEPINLFVHYGVDEKIRKAGRRKVWLKSGGYIIIDEAEALTAIDVNTGKFVGKDNQEQMILKTNLEAAHVIARELKLRDIGGLIVIDFIDMRDPRNREAVLNELRGLLRKGHAKFSVSGISEFGLVEMTRKRVRQSLRKTIFTECPYCKGSGIVFTDQQIWIHLKNAIIEQLEKTFPRPDLVLHVNPTVKEFIERNYAEALRRIGERYGVHLTLAASEKLHVENYEIEKRRREGSFLDSLLDNGSSEMSNGSPH